MMVRRWHGDNSKRFAKEHTIDFLLKNESNRLGTAYIHGFNWGLKRAYQYFIEMDCDFRTTQMISFDFIVLAPKKEMI